MKKWLKKWLFKEELERGAYGVVATAQPDEAPYRPNTKIRIGTMVVMNGKLLEVASYKQNPHGPDWKTEYYILEEGRPLAEQIAVVMTMRGMGV